MGLLTGSIYFGWPSLAVMTLKSGGFSSLCTEDAFITDEEISGSSQQQPAICTAQEAAVQHLYSLTLFFMTAASLLAGAMIDSLGSRRTAILGYSLHVLADLCLASSHWAGDAFLYLGFALLGAATDTAFLPVLTASRLFPSNGGFIICILGSAASASFGVPPLLEAIADKLHLQFPLNIFWGYALGGPGLCLILACLFLPNSAFLDEGGGDNEEGQSNFSEQPQYEELEDTAERQSTADTEREAPPLLFGSCVSNNNENNNLVWFHIFSLEFFLLAIYFAVVSCAVVFYQEAPSRYFPPKIIRALEVALPFSFVPCILFGWIADKWGVLWVMSLATANGLIAYVCALNTNSKGKEGVCGYISVLCFTNFIAIFTSQIFVYAEKRFPPKHFGKIVGLLQLMGGTVALLCNPVYSAVAVYHQLSLSCVTKIIIALLAAQFIWILWLWRLQMKEQQQQQQRRVRPEPLGLEAAASLPLRK